MSAPANAVPEDGRLPSLDGLRAVSISLVIGAHATRTNGYPEWLSPFAPYLWDGFLGVRVFFVISGFLITWLLLQEQAARGRIDFGAFYKRRALRILPVFYLYLFVAAVSTLWIHRDYTGAELLSAATFTRNFIGGGWTLGHLWSISVEEQFYFLWPFVLALLRTRRQLMLVSLAVIALAPVARVAIHLSPWRDVPGFGFVTQADSLMFGAILAIVLGRNPESTGLARAVRQQVGWVRGAALAAIYLVWLLNGHGIAGPMVVPFGPTVQAFCIAALIASVIVSRQGVAFRILNTRLLAWLGVLSYSLYIWQQMFLYPAAYEDGGVWWRSFPLNLLLLLAAACVSYYLVEKPLLKLKRRFAVA